MKRRSETGITLIALIITIILMLILAGVVIGLTLGKNGLINTAKYAVKKNEEETAREKLELALADLQAHKYTDEGYDENEYIDNYLINEEIPISENIAFVDGWRFKIDRTVPKISESLGKGNFESIAITVPYIGTSSFTTKNVYVYNEEEIESYTYKIDGVETKTNIEKEYTTENEVEPESIHTAQVIAKYKNGKMLESNIVTIKTEPRTYLYNNGDECIDITGGWQAIAVDNGWGDTTVKEPTLSNNPNAGYLNAKMYSDIKFRSGSITIKNQIDYTKYKYIKMIYTASLGNYKSDATINIYKNHENTSTTNYLGRLCYTVPISTKTEYVCNISEISDFKSFYIYLQCGTVKKTASINIYEMWLEK